MKKAVIFIIIVILLNLYLVFAKEVVMNVGDSVIINHKNVRLENVGSGGAIVVSVDGLSETIPMSTSELVRGIEVRNKETYYEDNKDQRSALLDLSFTEVSYFCSNGEIDDETEEAGIDCGGPFCPTKICPTCGDNIKNQDETDIDCGGSCRDCKEGKKCNEDSDCMSDSCSDDNKCCEYLSKNEYKKECKTGEPVSRGDDEDGCKIGWSCCGDQKCQYKENKENCPEDCKPPEPEIINKSEPISEIKSVQENITEKVLVVKNYQAKKEPFHLTKSIWNFILSIF
ncbi:MAG: hypothetical protein PHG05_02800 [Candidatus Nanoarchaeia archaeon]|nr:hypothetical protein [Candidatus Nanoarchaeia archaeon]